MKLPCPDHTREARPAPIWVNALKTAIQITIFWGFFLFLVPALLVQLEAQFGVVSFSNPAARVAGAVLFPLMGSIGIYCGMIFAFLGSGTPLPLDTTTKLVIVGPYRYVRNPMAITGITQGFAAGLFLGSPLTLVYSLSGAFAWNYLARSWEEQDLSRRFGEEYDRYRGAVKCWIPRLTPYDRKLPPSGLPPADAEG